MTELPPLLLAVSLAALATMPARAAVAAPPPSDAIVVTAAQTNAAALNESASATGLDLSLRETPQSVTVIDRQRIEDFALTSVNDLLEQAVGVTVDRNETDRTTYFARGFAITNMQVDGIGLPLLGAVDGDLDTILYERVDIVRGANAIMTGIGNPSATINYLRKRPTPRFQANAAAYAGSFDLWRVEGDVSGPVTADGSVRVRLIGAHEQRHSYLDYNRVNRDVAGALIAWDMAPGLTATMGYSRQDNRARGTLWGALPLVYADGTRVRYRRSASTAAPWTFVDTVNQTAFGELRYPVAGDWSMRGVFTYNDADTRSRRLYASGTPDPQTGLGVTGTSGLYPSRNRQYLLDGYASGSVGLFGRRHRIAIGVSNGWLRERDSEASSTATIDYGDIRTLGSVVPTEPAYPDPVVRGRERDRLTRLYGAIHLDVTDRLKGVAGVSAVWLRTTGVSYGADLARRNRRISPYAGLLFDLTRHLTLYASYTDIFAPQSQVDVTLRRLDPAKGTSIEGGVKGSWLDGRLYAAASVFRARQRGLARYVGDFNQPGGPVGPIGGSYYVGEDTTARGVEAEVSGRVTGRWLLSGGFTHLRIRNDAGAAARTFVPRDQLKLAATWELPEWRDLKLGAQVRYQGAIRATDDTGGLPIRQGGYAVLDLLAGIRVVDHVEASVNVRNATGVKYLNSLEWGQAFYAPPRSAIGTLRFSY